MILVTTLESQLSEKNHECDDIRYEYEKKVEDLVELQHDLRQRSNQIALLDQQLDKNTATSHDYQQQLTTLRGELEDERQEKIKLMDQVTERENEIRQSLEQLQSHYGGQLKTLELELDQLRQGNKSKEDEILQLNQQLDTTSHELEEKASLFQQLKTRMTQVNVEIDEKLYQANRQDMDIKLIEDQLSQERNHNEQLQQQLSTQQQQCIQLTQQLQSSQDHHDLQQKSKQEQIDQLEQVLTTSRSELHQQANEIVELKETVSKRQKMLEQSTQRIAELEESQIQLQWQLANVEQTSSADINSYSQECHR